MLEHAAPAWGSYKLVGAAWNRHGKKFNKTQNFHWELCPSWISAQARGIYREGDAGEEDCLGEMEDEKKNEDGKVRGGYRQAGRAQLVDEMAQLF